MQVLYLTFGFMTVILSIQSSNAADCSSKIKDVGAMQNISMACFAKLNLKLSDIPQSLEQLKKTQDDKCLSKCILESSKYFTAEGNFDRNAILKDIENRVEIDILPKITEITTNCLDSTEKIAKPNGIKTDQCKYSTIFSICMAEDSMKMTC